MEFLQTLPSCVTFMFQTPSSYPTFPIAKTNYNPAQETVIRTIQSIQIYLLLPNSMNSPLQPCWSPFSQSRASLCAQIHLNPLCTASFLHLSLLCYPAQTPPFRQTSSTTFAPVNSVQHVLFEQYGQHLTFLFLYCYVPFSISPEFLHRPKLPV